MYYLYPFYLQKELNRITFNNKYNKTIKAWVISYNKTIKAWVKGQECCEEERVCVCVGCVCVCVNFVPDTWAEATSPGSLNNRLLAPEGP